MLVDLIQRCVFLKVDIIEKMKNNRIVMDACVTSANSKFFLRWGASKYGFVNHFDKIT